MADSPPAPVIPAAPLAGPRLSPRLVLALEAALVAFGVALRARFDVGHLPSWGFDSSSHWAYINYIAQRHQLPPIQAFRAAYHPPLYYLIASAPMRHGWNDQALRALSTVMGGLRLLVIAAGLRAAMPGWPIARLLALALAAVLPCALHIDCMLSNEALNGLAAACVLAFAFATFRAETRRRFRLLPALALALTAAFLTKVSSLVLLVAVAAGAGLELVARSGSPRARLLRFAPPVVAVALAFAVSVPVYARHRQKTGHIFSSGYEGGARTLPPEVKQAQRLPYLKRRDPSYLVGASGLDILRAPYYPTDVQPVSHFWPVLFASTFADYYNYHYAGFPAPGEPSVQASLRPMGLDALRWARRSVVGGVPIALATLGALAACALLALRRRDVAVLVMLAVPVLAVLGQLHFAISFPVDKTGPVKAHYAQFAAPPLYAMFGVGVEWLLRRPRLQLLALLPLAGLALVTGYTLFAVTR